MRLPPRPQLQVARLPPISTLPALPTAPLLPPRSERIKREPIQPYEHPEVVWPDSTTHDAIFKKILKEQFGIELDEDGNIIDAAEEKKSTTPAYQDSRGGQGVGDSGYTEPNQAGGWLTAEQAFNDIRAGHPIGTIGMAQTVFSPESVKLGDYYLDPNQLTEAKAINAMMQGADKLTSRESAEAADLAARLGKVGFDPMDMDDDDSEFDDGGTGSGPSPGAGYGGPGGGPSGGSPHR